MSELSRRTDLLIRHLFAPACVDAVRARIRGDCGTEALGFPGATPEQMERVHFAVIRLGAADEAALTRAIELARIDYRDLLMNADFGFSLVAHDEWFDRVMRGDAT